MKKEPFSIRRLLRALKTACAQKMRRQETRNAETSERDPSNCAFEETRPENSLRLRASTAARPFRPESHDPALRMITPKAAAAIRGREAFAGHIVDEGFVPPPEITVNRLTEENDVVVAEGSVRAPRTDGTVLRLAFCDVFEMRDGLIRRLVSYLAETK